MLASAGTRLPTVWQTRRRQPTRLPCPSTWPARGGPSGDTRQSWPVREQRPPTHARHRLLDTMPCRGGRLSPSPSCAQDTRRLRRTLCSAWASRATTRTASDISLRSAQPTRGLAAGGGNRTRRWGRPWAPQQHSSWTSCVGLGAPTHRSTRRRRWPLRGPLRGWQKKKEVDELLMLVKRSHSSIRGSLAQRPKRDDLHDGED